MRKSAGQSSSATGELALGAHAKARILIVDDHPLIREGLAMLVQRQEDLECCATADSADSALKATAAHKPALVTVDLCLQQGDGLDLIRDLLAQKHAALI